MCEIKITMASGFCISDDLRFKENGSDLVYEKAYNLNMKLLVIDLLMINETGKLFHGHIYHGMPVSGGLYGH